MTKTSEEHPVLDGAKRINEGRSDDHGSPEDSFQRIAHYWTAYLINSGVPDPNIRPADVAEMMTLFKIARAQGGEYNTDDYRDGAGYLSHANRLRND
jgi:hypothetical protein